MNLNPKSIKSTVFYSLVNLILCSETIFAASQVLTLTENKRLEANIASNMMNRLTVTNDRIVNVFGDEGAFVTQTDEHTGQVFIKPTPENATHPLSITLITENGLTQDLLLKPVDSTASTVILKTSHPMQSHTSPQEVLLPGFYRGRETEQEQWITAMKQAVLGELSEFDGKAPIRARKCEGFQIKPERTLSSGSWIVQVFSIKNTSQLSEELLEKTFYQAGDVALSLQKRILQPQEKTLLYVLGNF